MFALHAVAVMWKPLSAILACCLALASCQTNSPGVQTVPTDPSPFRCEPITINTCTDIGYANATFPNFRGQDTQREADTELQGFWPLIRAQCSNAIVHMLCAVYAPFCSPQFPNVRVRPCKNLCMHVREGCEARLRSFRFDWPPHLDCVNYPTREEDSLCFGPPDPSDIQIPQSVLDELGVTRAPPSSPSPTGSMLPNVTDDVMTDGPTLRPTTSTVDPSSVTKPTSPPRTSCPSFLQVSSNIVNKSFSFAGVPNCGINCSGLYFTPSERNVVAPTIILIASLACVVFTLFTVATFLIDRRRFHYPERPIIFLSFCYLVISLAYIVGSISKLVGGDQTSFACTTDQMPASPEHSRSFVFQRLPNDNAVYQTASCVILFVMVYYFQMASALWWVVLTLTWFLAAALKWGEEAVERLWLLYHIVSWSVPAMQVILVLALRLVDGDQLAGLCYTGNHDVVGLGVFVFLPLALYLLLGLIFLIIGFMALVKIRQQLQRDAVKSRKLGRLIARIAVYSTLYTIPNAVLLILHIYSLAQQVSWEEEYLRCASSESNCPPQSTPTFAAFVLKYLMLFAIGIFSTSWIMSRKTLSAWKKFFQSCGCQQQQNQKAYELPVKSFPPPPHQTAV